MKEKKIRTLIPYSIFDIPGIEHWLEEKANEGLFPTHLGSWATFEEGAKPGTRFRLDAMGPRGSTPEPERLDLYRDMGWEYALNVGRAFHLFYATDPAAVELHTDPETRSRSMDRLAKRVRRTRWHHILYPFFLVLLFLLPTLLPASRFDAQPERFADLPMILIGLGHPIFLFFLLVLLVSHAQELKELRGLLALHRRLREGLPPEPSPGPSKAILRRNGITLLLVPVSFLFWLWCVAPGLFGSLSSPPLEEFQQPYVSIQELEDEPLYTWEELFDGMPRQKSNFVELESSVFSRTWYTVEQKKYSAQAGTMAGSFSPNPDGGKYRYSPSLDATYIHLRIPAMVRPVAESLLYRMRLINLWWEYEEVSHPGADFVILAHCGDNPWQLAAVAKGGKVAVFRYGGQQELANHLDTLTAVVN